MLIGPVAWLILRILFLLSKLTLCVLGRKIEVGNGTLVGLVWLV